MKMSIFFTILICLNFSNILLSQEPSNKPLEECNKPLVCLPKPYLYYFCNGEGKIIVVCSSEPNSNTDPWTQDDFKKPVRINLPICLTFVDSGPEIISVEGCTENRCYTPRPVYRKSDMLSQLQQAQKRINCLCNKENDSCLCTVKVKFSSNDLDFQDPFSQPSSSSIKVFKRQADGIINSDCSLNCENLFLYLNDTEKYTRKSYNEDGVYSQFFVIDEYFYTDATLAQSVSLKAFNLLDILNYELGSFLGLGKPYGTYPEFEDCKYDGIYDAQHNSLKSTFMSDDDKCMIINKYCNPTSVDKIITPFEYLTYVSNNKLQIIWTTIKNPRKIEIFSTNGQLVGVYDLRNIFVQQNYFEIDLQNFISGVYIITIYEENEQISFSNFILSK